MWQRLAANQNFKILIEADAVQMKCTNSEVHYLWCVLLMFKLIVFCLISAV